MYPELSTAQKVSAEATAAADATLARLRDNPAPAPVKAHEAAIPPGGVMRDPGAGFRPLTAQSERELNPLAQERMIEIAYYQYETNPLAGGILETTRDFIVGEGISFEAKHPKVEASLKKFWKDPVNQLDLKLPKKVLELGLYGEQCYPAFVSEFAGNVRLGYVDPANIKEVVADPENCECHVGVALKSRGNRKGKRYKTILPGEAEEILSAEALKLRDSFSDGECFYFSINNVSNATRGRSDLLRIADWADAYEEFLYDRLDTRALINSFIWDVTFTGLSEEQIKEKMKDMPAPKRGTVFGHNENVKREAIAPDLKADDASKDATVFKNHILGARGMPPPWFGEGGDVNRATAGEMEPRIIKVLSARQKIVIAIVQSICVYVLRQKIARGELDEEVAVLDDAGQETGEMQKSIEAFSITAPDISIKDIQKTAMSLQPIAVALLTAESQGWVSKDDAAKIFSLVVSTLGVTIKPQSADDKTARAKDSQPRVTKDYSEEAMGQLRRAYGETA